MSRTLRAACLQVSPGNDVAANLAVIAGLTQQAVAAGATLVALPEFATHLDRDSRAMRASSALEAESAVLAELRALAASHHVWLLVGSLVMQTSEGPQGRLANRSFLLSPQGVVVADYDKIHLFDAVLKDGRTVGESRHYQGGTQAPVVQTAIGNIGMTICYDLRFPHLYRKLALAGAEILSIPAAFTAETGAAHWEVLLRARAIETGAFVLAPATSGLHPGDWRTWGHAAIIDPSGRVLASCQSEEASFCIADLDLDLVAAQRGRIPSLTTNPDFTITQIAADLA